MMLMRSIVTKKDDFMATVDAVTSGADHAPTWRVYAVLLTGVLALALAAIFIRLALAEGVPALVIAAARLVIASLLLTPVMLRGYRHELRCLRRRDWLFAGVAGVFLALHFATWVSSLQYTTVLISGVLVTTTPIWAGIIEVAFLKAKLSRGIVAGLVIALIGSVMIALPNMESGVVLDDQALLGGVLSAVGAIMIALYMVIGRTVRGRISLLPYIWLVYSITAAVLVLIVGASGLSFTGYSAHAYLLLLLMALFPQMIGHSAVNYALAYLPATYVGMATQLEPIGSAIIAFFVFAEQPTALQALGSLIIMGGVYLATQKPTANPE